jgi:hypothetical protein
MGAIAMSITQTSTATRAYIDGYKAGRADHSIGWKSRYVWATQKHEGEYVWHYSVGYRTGWLGLQF